MEAGGYFFLLAMVLALMCIFSGIKHKDLDDFKEITLASGTKCVIYTGVFTKKISCNWKYEGK